MLKCVQQRGGYRIERDIPEHDHEYPSNQLGLDALDFHFELRNSCVEKRNGNELCLRHGGLHGFRDPQGYPGLESAFLNESFDRHRVQAHVPASDIPTGEYRTGGPRVRIPILVARLYRNSPSATRINTARERALTDVRVAWVTRGVWRTRRRTRARCGRSDANGMDKIATGRL